LLTRMKPGLSVMERSVTDATGKSPRVKGWGL